MRKILCLITDSAAPRDGERIKGRCFSYPDKSYPRRQVCRRYRRGKLLEKCIIRSTRKPRPIHCKFILLVWISACLVRAKASDSHSLSGILEMGGWSKSNGWSKSRMLFFGIEVQWSHQVVKSKAMPLIAMVSVSLPILLLSKCSPLCCSDNVLILVFPASSPFISTEIGEEPPVLVANMSHTTIHQPSGSRTIFSTSSRAFEQL